MVGRYKGQGWYDSQSIGGNKVDMGTSMARP